MICQKRIIFVLVNTKKTTKTKQNAKHNIGGGRTCRNNDDSITVVLSKQESRQSAYILQ